jgi:hypothetical protein
MMYLLASRLTRLMHLTLHYPLSPLLTGKTNHHPGNIKWRLIVEERKDEYMASIPEVK